MANLRLVELGRLAAVLLLACACAAQTPAPLASQTAPPPAATASVAPRPASTATRAATLAATVAPTLTPWKTATVTAEPTSTPVVGAGQVLSINQIIGLSFIDAQQGWLLASGPCVAQACPITMRQTRDGGQTWTSIPAPAAQANFFPTVFTPPSGGPASVSSIRFASARDGWAFGPSFYSTHDGGQTWHDEQRTVSSLAIVHGAVWAVEQQGSMAVVVRSTDAGQSWAPTTMQPLLIGWPVITSVNAQTAWLFTQDSVLNPQLIVTNDDGLTWTELHMPLQACQTALVKPVTPLSFWYICGGGPATDIQDKRVYTSSDGGILWQLQANNDSASITGQIPIVGLVGPENFSAPSASLAFMALGRSTLIVTRDAGRHWTDAIPYMRANGGGDPAMGPVEFVNANEGWLAVGPNRLFRTRDGGHNWSEISVR